MNLSSDGLLSYCTLGFAWLLGSMSLLLDSSLGKEKISKNYFKAAVFNSIRMSQLSSALFMVSCFVIICSDFFDKNMIAKINVRIWLLSTIYFATGWMILIFVIEFLNAINCFRKDFSVGERAARKYRKLNNV